MILSTQITWTSLSERNLCAVPTHRNPWKEAFAKPCTEKLLQETERRLIRDWKINHLMITRRRYRRKEDDCRSSEIIAPLQKRRTRGNSLTKTTTKWNEIAKQVNSPWSLLWSLMPLLGNQSHFIGSNLSSQCQPLLTPSLHFKEGWKRLAGGDGCTKAVIIGSTRIPQIRKEEVGKSPLLRHKNQIEWSFVCLISPGEISFHRSLSGCRHGRSGRDYVW